MSCRKGEYVEVEKEELEAVQIESNHTIDIDSFVPRDEIDKRYLNHPYYIAPDGKAGIDAFAVIRDAMKDQDRVALARIVLTNREHVIAIEPLGKGLLGTTLRYPYELRDEDEYFDDIKNPKISKDMVELASHILDTKAAHFDPVEIQGRVRGRAEGAGAAQGLRQDDQGCRARGETRQRHQSDGCAEASLKGKGAAKRADACAGVTADAAAPNCQEGASLGGAGAEGGLITSLSVIARSKATKQSRLPLQPSGLLRFNDECAVRLPTSSISASLSPSASSQPSWDLLALGPRLG